MAFEDVDEEPSLEEIIEEIEVFAIAGIDEDGVIAVFTGGSPEAWERVRARDILALTSSMEILASDMRRKTPKKNMIDESETEDVDNFKGYR